MTVDIDIFAEEHLSKTVNLAVLENKANGVSALAQQLGYDEELTIGALEDGIRLYQRRTVEDLLEMGKRLLLLKELSAHGEFTKRAELLGISQRMAQRFMQATIKFTKSVTVTHLAKKAGSQRKLLELLVLDDDELEAIAAGDSVNGLTLDGIDCMSVSELRAALRNERDAHQKQINALNTEKNIVSDRIKAYEKKLAEPLLSRQTDALMQISLNSEAMATAGIDHLNNQVRELNQGGEHVSERAMTLHSCLLALNARISLTLNSLNEVAENLNMTLPEMPKMVLSEEMARDYLAAHTGYVETAIELAKKAVIGRTDVLGKTAGRPRKNLKI